MQNVQKREALPLRTTYSSTHRGQLGYGVGEVYIPKSPVFDFFFFFGWGGLRTSCVSGKGNKGPLCPVGVGPPVSMDTNKSTNRNMESEVKSGRGRARSDRGLAHVMARRRLPSLCA